MHYIYHLICITYVISDVTDLICSGQHGLSTEFGPISDGCRNELDSVSRNAANDVREEQNLHKFQVSLLKPSAMLNWRWSTACGSRYGSQTSPSVTALDTSVDAPGNLWSAFTAHHTTWNEPHILQKLDANVVVTKQECYKQLIWNGIGAQCLRPCVVDETYGFTVIRCWYVVIIWGSADKSLARPRRKEATVTKLGIYSTYSPRSSMQFLARCSNLCKPLKTKFRRLSIQVSAAAMTSASDEKWLTFNCFFFLVQGTGGSPTGPDPENRVGDQDNGSPGRPGPSGLQVPGGPGHCRARRRLPWWPSRGRRFSFNCTSRDE